MSDDTKIIEDEKKEKRSTSTPVSIVEEWIKDNKAKQAAQVVKVSKQDSRSLSCNHLFKDNGRKALPPRTKKGGQRPKSIVTIKFEQDVDAFKKRIIAGELILMSEFGDRDKANVFRIVTRACEADLDILTLTRASIAIGWVLSSVAFAKL